MVVKSVIKFGLVCALGAVCCFFTDDVCANLITNGDFSSGSDLVAINGDWDSSANDLNAWHTWTDGTGHDFYSVSNGQATVDRAWWDDSSSDVKAVKLAQVIAAPTVGSYDLSFDYQITNDSTQYSVFRVFGIDAGSDGTFSMDMGNWDISASGATVERLYDQGNKYSYLSETNGIAHVNTEMVVNKQYDYLVVYAAFSYDGNASTADMALLDNVSLSSNAIPEPASIVLLAGGMIGLVMRKKVKRS